MTLITTEEFDRGVTLELHYDGDAQYADPRDYDNLGTMVCWHRRAHLGDETVKPDESYAESMEEFVKEHTGPDALVIPLWLYEHGGRSMTAADANPYHCRWDSGQVGFIYCTPETVVKEYGSDTPENRQTAREVMEAEVREYDLWLRGEVYGYVVDAPHPDFDGESCWGFIGDEDYVLKEGRYTAKAAVKWLINLESQANFATILAHFGATP